ncbi:hypothetical protein CapIbe_008825 [Capra ibex]
MENSKFKGVNMETAVVRNTEELAVALDSGSLEWLAIAFSVTCLYQGSKFKEELPATGYDVGNVQQNCVRSLTIPKYDTYNLPLVKTDLVFCKPLKFPPVENEEVDESETVSQERTNGFGHDTPAADIEWPATRLAL